MAERKQTPNILNEIISGSPAEPMGTPQPDRSPRPPRAKPAASVKTSTTREKPRKKWQHRLVSFQDFKGWRPRFVDGVELADWFRLPIIHEYLSQAAEDGWELVAATSGEKMYALSDKIQLYFIKRD
jgi:hypothetical protein